jgi:hypothetical protein
MSERWMRCAAGLALVMTLVAGAAGAQPAPDRMWVQLTGRGAELRLITAAARCPDAELDGRPTPMRLRAGPTDAFPAAVCALEVPEGVRHAAIGDWSAPLLRRPPRRILIFGDTGCRLKGIAVQACNDPRQWPFALVAARAAAARPDLVIHVGDYYYRESPCPAGVAGCAGSPHGDNAASWDAEFLGPAEPLLKSAPWVFARGNHESCSRGGLGWFRLLDAAPDPLTCPAQSEPFKVALGDLDLWVLDSADTDDQAAPPKAVDAFARQLDAVTPAQGRPAWIVTHRPIWAEVDAAKLGPLGPVEVPINATEQAAARGRDLAGVQMIVSGHIHHFASYDFGPSRPAQLVAGTGGDVGDAGDSARPRPDDVKLDGLPARGFTFMQYGYLLLDREGDGWKGVFRDLDDKLIAACRLQARDLTCERVRSPPASKAHRARPAQ